MDGGVRSDLIEPGRFLLIAGEKREGWCAAATELAAATGIPLDAPRIGHLDGDLFDPRCTWLRHPIDELTAAFGQILARPIGALATTP